VPLKKVRDGLYERTDTPKRVPLSGRFIKAVRSSTGSEVITEVVRRAGQGVDSTKDKNGRG